TKVFITATGIHYQFMQVIAPETATAEAGLPPRMTSSEHMEVRTHRFSVQLAGANPQPAVRMENERNGVENFYLAHCPNGITGVKSYQKLVFENVYPHIDWVVYSTGDHMKYDFVVRPGGNPAQIRLAVTDAEKVSLTAAGELQIETSLGELREQAPESFINGQ